tara:strand:+ start:85781 stop:85930 length:150 start_codon:yes stop_codon:yes gene_type:complete
MSIEPIKVSGTYEKPIKIVLLVIAIIAGMFIIGALKDVPVYQVQKEVAL